MSILIWKNKALGHTLQGGGGKGGGGGGGPQQVTSTSTTSNIPEYAKPYVTNMLKSAQAQIYNDDMTSFRGYNPYSSDVNNYFAGFSPMQQKAQEATYNLQTPSQYGLASELAGQAGMGGMQAQNQANALSNQALGYGQAGQMYGDVGQMYGAQGAQQAQIAAQNAQLQAQRYGQQAVDTGQQALGYGAQGARYGQGAVNLGQTATELARQQGLGYGAQGAGYGAQAAGLAGQATNAGQAMADIGAQGLGYGAQGAGYGGRGAQAAEQGFSAGERFASQATDPNSVQAYMSPYMKNVVDYQKSQATRDYGIAQQARQAGATSRGAFGGSRQAIENAEAQRNLMSQLQGIEGTGAQNAFQNAQAQQQFGSNLGIQGLQAGYGGLGLGMQGSGVGLSGLGTAMQGRQGELSGLGQAGSLYGQGMQGAQTGLQGLQGALAGSSQGLQGYNAGMQGSQTGMQGVQGAMAGYNTGLSGVGQQLGAGQLNLQGTGQGIQGAQAGMQGSGYGLQGVQGAVGAGNYGLQGMGLANQSANTLGTLGGQQLGSQQNIINMLSTLGGQQQSFEQSKINQAIQDYATAQQYPFMQLGMMNSMLRGLPMQNMATTQYQATPSYLTQGLGAVGTLGGAYKAFGGAGGGTVDSVKGFKEGGPVKGIAAFSTGDVVNSVRAKLEEIANQPGGIEKVQQIAQSSSSEEVRKMAAVVVAQHKMTEQAEGSVAPLPPQQSQGIAALPAPAMDQMASGGIVAFAEGDLVDEDLKYLDLAEKQQKAALERAGITGAPNAKMKEFLGKQVGALPGMKESEKGLMMMDYFSNLGTQTGPLSYAALKAAKDTTPSFRKGLENIKKAEADVMKGQNDLENADRLEALGLNKEASALRKDAETNKRAFDIARMQTDATLKAAGMNAGRATDADKRIETFRQALIARLPEADRAAAQKDPLIAEQATQKYFQEQGLALSKVNVQENAQLLKDIATDPNIGEKGALTKSLSLLQLQYNQTKNPEKQKELKAKIDEVNDDIAAERIKIQNRFERKNAQPPANNLIPPAPDISTISGAPAGSAIAAYVKGQGYEIRDKSGKLLGYAK